MKKDIRNLIYLDQPIYIIFDDYSHYLDFCKFTTKIIQTLGYVPLHEVLTYVGFDNNFKIAYEYGYSKKIINNSLIRAELHKFKRKYKTDGTWPISIKLPIPENILQLL